MFSCIINIIQQMQKKRKSAREPDSKKWKQNERCPAKVKVTKKRPGQRRLFPEQTPPGCTEGTWIRTLDVVEMWNRDSKKSVFFGTSQLVRLIWGSALVVFCCVTWLALVVKVLSQESLFSVQSPCYAWYGGLPGLCSIVKVGKSFSVQSPWLFVKVLSLYGQSPWCRRGWNGGWGPGSGSIGPEHLYLYL